VIEALTPHTTQKAFTDRIGSRRVVGRFQDLDAAGCGHAREIGSKLAIIITVSCDILGMREAALDLYFQKSLKPRRCHRRSVSGWTMNKACFQVRTILASRTRSMRSVLLQAGRFTWRRRMITC